MLVSSECPGSWVWYREKVCVLQCSGCWIENRGMPEALVYTLPWSWLCGCEGTSRNISEPQSLGLWNGHCRLPPVSFLGWLWWSDDLIGVKNLVNRKPSTTIADPWTTWLEPHRSTYIWILFQLTHEVQTSVVQESTGGWDPSMWRANLSYA